MGPALVNAHFSNDDGWGWGKEYTLEREGGEPGYL